MWRSAYPRLWLFFLLACLHYYCFFSFFINFGYKLFVDYRSACLSFPTVFLAFLLLMVSFDIKEVLIFNVQFSVFFCMVSAFVSCIKNISQLQNSGGSVI